MTIIFIY